MISINIQRLCKARGIANAYQLQKAGGFAPSHASSLFNETFKQLSLKTIETLCRVLNCQVGDLANIGNSVEEEPLTNIGVVVSKRWKNCEHMVGVYPFCPLCDGGYECDGQNCPPRAHDHYVY